MKRELNVLYLDNSNDGATVVNKALMKGNLNPTIILVDNRYQFIKALAEFSPDIILSEYKLPDIDCNEALEIILESGIIAPFIVLSDEIEDEMATELLLIGVDDYVLKSQPGRLPFAIVRSIEKYDVKREQQALLEQLSNSEMRFRALVDYSADAVVILNEYTQATYVSPSVKNVLGYTPHEVMNMDLFSKVHPDDLEKLSGIMDEVLANPGVPIQGHAGRMLHKDASWRWIEATVTNLLHEPAINGIVDNFRDVTKKMAGEASILHLNRLYAFLSQVNHTLVHARDEQTVFKEVCRIAYEAGTFQATWIGMLDADHKLNIVESWGINIEALKVFAEADHVQEQIFNYLQSNSYYVSNDIGKDCIPDHWQALATYSGSNSCIVLPIRRSGNIVGNFNLYAPDPGFFTTAEITLLEKAASGISFSLDYFEQERSKNAADLRLRHKESRLSQAQAIAHLGSWEMDLSTCIVVWSDESCRIHGIPESDNVLSEASWLSFVHPEDLEQVVKISEHALKSRKGADYHHRIIRKDGQVRYLHVQTEFEFSHQGEPVCVYGVLHDVTEMELSRQALQRSESNLHAIMNNTDALIYSLDKDLRYITYNQELENMMKEGYGVVVKPGYDIRESMKMFDPDGAAEWEQINIRAFAGEMLKFEKVLLLNGSPTYLKFSIHPIKENNTVTGLSCFVNDITREKQADQKALEALEDRNIILESIGDAFYAVDSDWLVTYWNNQAEVLFNCPKEKILGKCVWDIFPDIVDTVFHKSYKKALKENTIQQFESCYNKRWFEVAAYPTNNGLSIYLREITERKKTESQLHELNESLQNYANELIASNKGLEQFSYIVSHNLRAPVANIIGLSALIEDDIYPAEVKEEFLQGILINVKRLDDIISDLNTILQTKRGVSENREVVFLQPLVNDILASIQNIILEEHVDIQIDFSAVDKLFTLKSYLHSILYNLIMNSIKYRQKDISPAIRIKSSQHQGQITISVKDNGLGVDLVRKGSQLFGMYKRFHHHVEGKGMGLFMVKTQVEMLGGKIAVSSEVNKGTEFQIEFHSKDSQIQLP